MATLTLKNYRGVASASIDLAGQITLLAGKNGAGKSSCCMALAALLTGEANPITLKRGGDKAIAVRVGEAAGGISLVAEAGDVKIAYPAGEITTRGAPPSATDLAAGLVSWTDLTGEERGRRFGAAFRADPAKEDLASALREAGLADCLGRIWAEIGHAGWAVALQRAEDEAKLAKRDFQSAAGILWGENKAPKWLEEKKPTALRDALDSELAEAKAQRDRSIASGARRDAKAASTGEDRMRLLALSKELKLAEAGLAGARSRSEAASKALAGLKPPAGAALSCPCCGVILRMDGGALVDASDDPPTDPATYQAAVRERDEADRAHKAAMAAHVRLDGERSTLEARLDRVPADDAPAPGGGAELAEIDQHIRAVEKRLGDLEAWARASDAHRRVVEGLEIAEILSAKGAKSVLRRKALEVIEIVNGRLVSLSEAMGCKPVTLDQDLGVLMGDLPLRALSQSERWRALALVQVLVAQHDGSALVILDGADVLDQPGRNGLIKVLRSAGLKAVIGMTVNKVDLVPDLSKARLGSSYWIDATGAAVIGGELAEDA